MNRTARVKKMAPTSITGQSHLRIARIPTRNAEGLLVRDNAVSIETMIAAADAARILGATGTILTAKKASCRAAI